MLVYGVIGIAGCQMTYYMAVQDSNAGIATVLQYTAPVMIMVLLAIRNRKLPEANEILALVLAFGGTVLLATHGNLTQLSVSKTTLVLGLASAVATVFYNLVPGNLMDIYGLSIRALGNADQWNRSDTICAAMDDDGRYPFGLAVYRLHCSRDHIWYSNVL